MTDQERYRQGLVHKLHHLVVLLEDAYAIYQKDPQLKKDLPHLGLWFPDRIKKMREYTQGATNLHTATSAAGNVMSLAHAFEDGPDWYKGGNIDLAASQVGSLATAYWLLAENEPLADIHRKRAEAALAHT